MKSNHLSVSEMFLSHQGEGQTAGHLAAFIRLAGCNLTCGIKPDDFKLAKKHNYSQDQINSLKTKNANWVCDSISSWMRGKTMDFDQILDELNKQGFSEAVNNGAHLIITGGEPLLWEKNLVEFIAFLSGKGFDPIIEIETNGTITPGKELSALVHYWNVSPKLSGSGMEYGQRIIKPALLFFNAIHSKAIFKFVISQPEDLEELNRLISELKLDKGKIWLMPAANNIGQLLAINKYTAKQALKNGFNFCSRLQVEVYDQTLGI